MDLGNWFLKMLEELEQDNVLDAAAIDDLRGRVAEAFADWRVKWGYYGPTGPEAGAT
jgi:hypothetical protein